MRFSVGPLALAALAGCGQGSVTFTLDAPAQRLSPLDDSRADAVIITDEATGTQLGSPLSVGRGDAMGGGSAIGPIRVGTYDLRVEVGGGGQLLGLARARDVVIAAGQDQSIPIHLRKPFAFFGSLPVLPAAPAAVMAFDSTLPPLGLEPDLGDIRVDGPVGASASTADGRFLLLGAKDQLYVVNTVDFSMLGKVGPIAGGSVKAIVVAPRDSAAAILTDQAVTVITDLQAFENGGPSASPVTTVTLAQPQAAAFSPDAQTLAVLSGPAAWQDVVAAAHASPAHASWESCDASLPKAFLSLLPVASLPASADETAAPAGATDVDFLDGRPVLALPCGPGIVYADDLSNPANLPVALAGKGIIDIAVVGGHAAFVEGRVIQTTVPVDPDQPRMTDTPVPFGSISTYVSGQPDSRVTSTFRLGNDLLNFVGSDMSTVQALLAPTRLDAYDVALSPDGTHVVVAARIRYEESALKYVPEVPDPNFPGFTLYCDLDIAEDVYQVWEVEATSGSVAYQSVKGLDDPVCSTQCFSCNVDNLGQKQCDPLSNPSRTPCTLQHGFAPGGLSVMMGGG